MMCVSIVIGINLADENLENITTRVEELGKSYGYGVGIGYCRLQKDAQDGVIRVMADPQFVFEVHDLPEPHCACDIEQDIRNQNKLGQKSKFFDFVREILEYETLQSTSVLFFQDELPNENNIREQLGSYEDFVQAINRWNTWQVEGFEPTRKAYFIAESTPLFYVFTTKRFLQ
jgi:hypothetical protein